MAFLRHVGKHNDRKVAIIFREVPGEPHMCLVTYTETLNQHIHDPLMSCIESDIGQNSKNLADALNRSYTKDGKIILQVLHGEHQLKKVQTTQIVMTPAPGATIRLDELNKMLDEMEQGEQAVKRMAEIDRSRGLQDPSDVARRMRGEDTSIPASGSNGLNDSVLAKQRLEQAQRMEREAKGLLAEAQRLMDEARSLDPSMTSPTNPAVSTEQPVKAKKPRVSKKVNVA